MLLTFTVVYLMMQANFVKAAILFPEEVPTLTGIIYSLLPPIKIGKDSRFGVGFRLGRNADAQVLIELGPQTETQPLGDGTSKRQSPDWRQTLSSELLKKWLDKIQHRRLQNQLDDNNSSASFIQVQNATVNNNG